MGAAWSAPAIGMNRLPEVMGVAAPAGPRWRDCAVDPSLPDRSRAWMGLFARDEAPALYAPRRSLSSARPTAHGLPAVCILSLFQGICQAVGPLRVRPIVLHTARLRLAGIRRAMPGLRK